MSSRNVNLPLVTIGIAVYTRANYLEKAVNSALAQTYGNVEIIISQNPTDTGPDADVARLCQKLLSSDSRLIYRCNEKNLGLAGNWNAIADAATGIYLAIMGDDDRISADFVERFMNATDDGPDVYFSNHTVIDSHGTVLDVLTADTTNEYQRNGLPFGFVTIPEKMAWCGAVPICASLILSRRVKELRFREELNTPEVEFFIRLCQTGGKFFFVPEFLSDYRVHGESETAKGLWVHRLATCLLPIQVSQDVEPYKRALLGKLIVPAVNQYFLAGDARNAAQLIHSEYYHSAKVGQCKRLLHVMCDALPACLSVHLFRFSYTLFNRLR